jgi:hypothetical protein
MHNWGKWPIGFWIWIALNLSCFSAFLTLVGARLPLGRFSLMG